MTRRLYLAFERLRAVRVVTYGLIAAAGTVGMIDPPTILVDQISEGWARLCASGWIVFGTLAVVSVFRKSLIGEFLLLRPMALAVWAFAVACGFEATQAGLRLLTYTLLFTALGVMLWGLWLIVDTLARSEQGGEK